MGPCSWAQLGLLRLLFPPPFIFNPNEGLEQELRFPSGPSVLGVHSGRLAGQFIGVSSPDAVGTPLGMCLVPLEL